MPIIRLTTSTVSGFRQGKPMVRRVAATKCSKIAATWRCNRGTIVAITTSAFRWSRCQPIGKPVVDLRARAGRHADGSMCGGVVIRILRRHARIPGDVRRNCVIVYRSGRLSPACLWSACRFIDQRSDFIAVFNPLSETGMPMPDSSV